MRKPPSNSPKPPEQLTSAEQRARLEDMVLKNADRIVTRRRDRKMIIDAARLLGVHFRRCRECGHMRAILPKTNGES